MTIVESYLAVAVAFTAAALVGAALQCAHDSYRRWREKGGGKASQGPRGDDTIPPESNA